MQLIKLFYLFLGFVCVGLGLLGIPLPGLPTTPFLLLALFFFAKGSDRVHDWFIGTALYKKHLKNFHQTRTLSLQAKVRILILSTSMIFLSAYLLKNPYVQLILLFLLIVQYCVFIFWIKTAPKKAISSELSEKNKE